MQLVDFFKTLTLHPKNAQELKGLILQLAIQGKLTANWREENPNIESATILLEKVKEEKIKLIKEKKIKKEKPLTPINKEDIPFELPNNWIWCRMLDFCYLITDGAHHTPKYVDEGIPFLSVKNLSKGFLDFSDTKFIERETHDELIKRCNPEYNDVLLTKIGTTGIAKVIDTKQEFSIFVSVALLKIAKKNLFPYYIENCINSPFIKKQSLDGTEGVGNKNLVLRKIKDFLIPLPPLEEQKEIVRVVEILFKEVEQLEQLTIKRIALKEDYVTSALQQLTTQNAPKEWQSLQRHFKDFFTEKSTIKKLRETVLQLAVQGKLTADWRSCHPELVSGSNHASELLQRIQKEKAQLIKDKKIKKERPLPAITAAEIPYELPEGSVWCRFQEVFDIRDGTHDSPKNVTGTNSYPLVTSKDFKNGEINFDTAKRISKEDYIKIIQRSLVEEDDILFSMIGGNLGNQVMVKGNTEFAIKNVALFKYYSQSLSVSGYLKTFSEHIAYAIQNKATGGAQPFVSLTFLRQMLIPLPPLEEQRAIVEKVNALMGLCDALEEQITTQKEVLESWMQSTVREVFEEEKV